MRQVRNLPRVKIEGVRVGEPLRLADLSVVQRLDAPSQCQINWLAPTLDIPALEAVGLAPGINLTVEIEEQSGVIFSGEITAVEHVHRPSGELNVRVRAYDPLVRLQRRQTLRTHVDVNTAELTRVLGEAARLKVNAGDAGPVWPRVMPRFKHDLAMLRHYAARSGLHFLVEDDELRLFSCRNEQSEPRKLTLGEDLFEARLEHNAIRPLADVEVMGWDSHTGEPRRSKVNAGATTPDATAHTSGETRSLLGSALESDGEAEALANTELEHSQSQSLVFWGVAEGDVALRPGRRVQLKGVAASASEPYRLTAVTHRVDAEGGYLSELSSRPEPLDPPQLMPSLVMGEVCDIDDPEKRGRVQVELTSYSDAVSTWMLVMQPGAGEGKGLVSLPEVGDQVIVALPDGDPSRGLVLGGVYGAEGPPHERQRSGASGQYHPYTLATRGGQRIQLNDKDGSIRFENASGSFLSLTPDGVVLHAAGQLKVESPGERLRLLGNRIDLERG